MRDEKAHAFACSQPSSRVKAYPSKVKRHREACCIATEDAGLLCARALIYEGGKPSQGNA